MSLRLPLPVVRRIISAGLRLHNLSYDWVGRLSRRLEPDGLHPKHRLMNYHGFFMDRVSPRDRVLDVGCGNGALALDLAPRCARVIGVDLSERNVAEARRRLEGRGARNVEFRVGDATRMSFEEPVDCVVLSNVLEHVEDRVGMLRRLAAAAPRLLIRVPLIERDWISLYKKELGIEHRLDPTHFIEYTQEGFAAELAEAGLEEESRQVRFGEIWASCRLRRAP